MADQQDNGVIRFRMDGLATGNKVGAWQDALRVFFYEFESKVPADFEVGSLLGTRIGDISVAQIRSDAMANDRTRGNIARDPRDLYFVLLPDTEPISLIQRGREALVSVGQFAIGTTSEPYSFIQKARASLNVLALPGEIMRRLSPRVDDGLAVVPSNSDTVGRMFVEAARTLCIESDRIRLQDRGPVVRHLLALLGIGLDGGDRQSGETGVRLAHRRRILETIDRYFSDPTLGVEGIAGALRLSKRYVQNIFASEGDTVSRAIRRRRIEEACLLLSRPAPHALRVGEVAYRVGFTDAAHFSRVFRQEVGCAPTDFTGS